MTHMSMNSMHHQLNNDYTYTVITITFIYYVRKGIFMLAMYVAICMCAKYCYCITTSYNYVSTLFVINNTP